jgi:hypothetical protein
LNIQQFAEANRLRTKEDSCGERLIPGKQFCTDTPKRVEYRSHVYEHGTGQLGVCLLFNSARKWEAAKRKMVDAGLTIRQNAHTEGTALFNSGDKNQVRLVLKLAGIKTRRTATAAQLAMLHKARLNRSTPCTREVLAAGTGFQGISAISAHPTA